MSGSNKITHGKDHRVDESKTQATGTGDPEPMRKQRSDRGDDGKDPVEGSPGHRP